MSIEKFSRSNKFEPTLPTIPENKKTKKTKINKKTQKTSKKQFQKMRDFVKGETLSTLLKKGKSILNKIKSTKSVDDRCKLFKQLNIIKKQAKVLGSSNTEFINKLYTSEPATVRRTRKDLLNEGSELIKKMRNCKKNDTETHEKLNKKAMRLEEEAEKIGYKDFINNLHIKDLINEGTELFKEVRGCKENDKEKLEQLNKKSTQLVSEAEKIGYKDFVTHLEKIDLLNEGSELLEEIRNFKETDKEKYKPLFDKLMTLEEGAKEIGYEEFITHLDQKEEVLAKNHKQNFQNHKDLWLKSKQLGPEYERFLNKF